MPFCITCTDVGKKTSASFNILGSNSAKYCASHKEEGMVNVINKLCAHVDDNGIACIQRPSFNVAGKKPLYCSLHKSNDMVNSLEKRCEGKLENGTMCGKVRIFNYPGKKGGLFCADHKEEGMVNVVNKMCEECGITVSSYGWPGKSKTHCSQHKKEGMLDLKHSKCSHSNCSKSPSYSYEGKAATHCVEHKVDGMVDVKHKKCITCKIKYPFYNYSGMKPALYCLDHKVEGMVDVEHTKCLSTWCDERYSNKAFEGYCYRCFLYLFPDKPIVRNYKTKETAVVEYIKTTFSNVTWITDKRVQDGCSMRRPDLFLDLGYQILIIEVDENQHNKYDCTCENRRIMEISKDVGHRNIVLIRFNPDDYIDKHGNRVLKCWTNNKQGVVSVNKNDSKRWNERLKTLALHVQYWIDNHTDKMLECIQLFYDEY
jgi:hypothetical protein